MLIPRKTEAPEKELLLGDYVTVNVPRWEISEAKEDKQCEMQTLNESFIQRAQKQRTGLSQPVKQQSGTLIDVRLRVVA